MDVRITVTNGSNVALEMADIGGIESYLGKYYEYPIPRTARGRGANNGHEEPDVSLSQTVADKVCFALQQSINTVKCFKERYDGVAICLGGRREASPVYAICSPVPKITQIQFQTRGLRRRRRRTVDPIIDPLVHAINLPAQLRRIQVELLRPALLRDERIELRVEDAYDLRRLVVHDRVLLLVPEHRHREAAGVVRVRAEVEVLHVLGPVERVGVRSWEWVH